MTGPKTVTPKQLAANRRNAQQCTGPRTPEGKARSRWNAVKHGVLAKAVVPQPAQRPAEGLACLGEAALAGLQPYESRDEFDHLLAVLRDEFAPQSAIEEMLIEAIATCYWRIARIVRTEAAAISQRLISAEDDVAEARTEANHQASYRAGFGHADTLRQQVVSLSKVMSDTPRLRDLMSRFDSHWRDAPPEQLLGAAEIRLDDLQRQLAEQESQELAAHRGMCSIPEIDLALSLSRYETRFYRQLNRALNELERIRRRREAAKRLAGPSEGDLVPPPVNVTITDSS